jgi:glycosyltransferase involved in cell wall biosynthesis
MKNRASNLKVAFLTKWDPLDPRSWSGTMLSMYAALERTGLSLTPFGPVRSLAQLALRCGNILTQSLIHRSYDFRHNFLVAREYSLRFERKLKAEHFDVIFAPTASCEISGLTTTVPIVYLSDILNRAYKNYYPQSPRLFEFSAAEVDKIELLAMQKAAHFICPTNWTANYAAESYGFAAERIHVLPFGPNLHFVASHEEATRRKEFTVCRLLLLGIDWERKGGQIAFDTLQYLLGAGIPAELTVCGCTPPAGVSHPNLKVVPFLSKRDPSQARLLADLLRDSMFLILPTQAEAFGVVFCEASAWGLPSIARNTGGVSGVIEDGVNGYKIEPQEGATAYARIIQDLYEDADRYHALRLSSRGEYERRLNWDIWGHGVRRVLEEAAG